MVVPAALARSRSGPPAAPNTLNRAPGKTGGEFQVHTPWHRTERSAAEISTIVVTKGRYH